jgi:hypothetical protein
VNRFIKTLLGFGTTLVIAGCSFNMAPPSHQANIAPRSHQNIPKWQAQHLARAACPLIVGRPTCLALILQSNAKASAVIGWKPSDLQKRYNLPSAMKG